MEKFHAKPTHKTLKILGVDQKEGLSDLEAARRLKQYGENKLPESKPPSGWIILLRQFNNFFTYILLVAAIITGILHEYIDMSIILVALLINVVVGFVQESKAQKAVSQLKKIIRIQAKVIRNGKIRVIDSDQLVPGDIILLDAGDKVPADARLVEALHFSIQEQALTGESTPINKNSEFVGEEGTGLGDRKNMVYMGTVVAQGKATAVVVSTGLKTEIGKIFKLVDESEEEMTPLQRRLKQLSLVIGIFAVLACVIIIILGVIKGEELGEMFIFAAAIAVSAVPEGLVIMVTVILAIGMRRILKRKAVVRELLSAETLGSTTVICSDKTGTITTGNMRADYLALAEGEIKLKNASTRSLSSDLNQALKIGALCNDLHIENPKADPKEWKIIGDPTEIALLEASIRVDQDIKTIRSNYFEMDEIPFDSDLKYMVTSHYDKRAGKLSIFIKGMTEKVIVFSDKLLEHGEEKAFDKNEQDKFFALNQTYSKKGYRVLALAYKEMTMSEEQAKNYELDNITPAGFVFVGLVAIRDPIREGIKDTMKLCRDAGIKIKMITGDHRLTAQAIADDIGLAIKNDKEIIDGEEFEKLSEAELRDRIPLTKVFARVAPKHKVKIVDVLQKQGEVVAMTGDGVNDSPALKEADIGIAMGSGTEAAKETSNIILLDNNFKTIVAAVEEGRLIFDNIRKVVLYLLSDGFAEIVIIGLALLLGWPIPLLPAQILWINLIDDGFPNIALTFEPKEKEIMSERPRKKNEPILDNERKLLIALVGLISGLGVLVMYYLVWKRTGNIDEARTVAFTTLALDSLLYVFSIRSLRHSILHERFFSNKSLVLAVGAGLVAQLAAVYLPPLQVVFKTTPLSLFDWLLILLEVVIVITVIEIVKYYFNRKSKKLITK